MVREYKRRCSSHELRSQGFYWYQPGTERATLLKLRWFDFDFDRWKHSWSYRSERPSYLRPIDRDNTKELKQRFKTPASCPIIKASNNSHFHSSYFFALYFPSQYQWFLLPFLISEIKRKKKCVRNHHTERTAPRFVCSTKLSLVLGGSYLDWWPDMNPPVL